MLVVGGVMSYETTSTTMNNDERVSLPAAHTRNLLEQTENHCCGQKCLDVLLEVSAFETRQKDGDASFVVFVGSVGRN